MNKKFNIFLWVIFFSLMAPSGMALASWNAVPGDATYAWKTSMEHILITVLPSDQLKSATHTRLTQRRLGEVSKVLSGTHAREGLDNLSSQIVLTQASINKISNVQDRKKAVNDYIKTLQDVSTQLEKEKQTRALAYLPPQQETANTFNIRNIKQNNPPPPTTQPVNQIQRKTEYTQPNTQQPTSPQQTNTTRSTTLPISQPIQPPNPATTNNNSTTFPATTQPSTTSPVTSTEETEAISEEIVEEIGSTQEEIAQIIEELETTLQETEIEEFNQPPNTEEPSNTQENAAPQGESNQGRNEAGSQNNTPNDTPARQQNNAAGQNQREEDSSNSQNNGRGDGETNPPNENEE